VPAIDTPLLNPSFEQEADRLTATVVRDGNSVTLMPSGVESYAKRWELIEKAQKSLHMVSFSFMRDDTTRRLAGIAADKVRAGVEVKIIVDDAALYTTFSRSILKQMAKAGVEVLTYDSPLRYLGFRRMIRKGKIAVKRRFHEKYLVVDGEQSVLGGMNWGTKYALGGSDPKWWRDTDVYLTGPVVADVQRRFLTDIFVYRAQAAAWKRRGEKAFDRVVFLEDAHKHADAFMNEHASTYFPDLATTGTNRIRYVGHKPWDEEAVPLTNAALHLVRSAQKTIYWGCHGVRPPRMMAENLAEAAARGVEVHVITNSKKSSRSLMGNGLLGWMWWECSHYFRWLVEHGIHVHEWQLPGAFHSKNMVVDDAVAAVGSYNVANGSCFHHTESAVIVMGGEFPAAVRKQFELDLQYTRELTLEHTKKPFIPISFFDPWRRPLHERNLLVDRSVWPTQVAADIDAGKIVYKYSDRPK